LISQAAVNAILNGTSAVLLVCGYAAIRSGKMAVHKRFMISAFGVSTAFLISYLIYHIRVHRVMLFQGQGWIRPVYFTILISHTILAAAVMPLVLLSLTYGLKSRFDKHRRISRWTFPVWLYVSVTGVIVYVMLYQIYGGHA